MSNTSQANPAKFAFYYLLSLVALLFMSISVGIIIFQIINKNLLDPLEQGMFSQELLRFAISALLIATPIFYVLMRQIYINLAKSALDKDSAVRRWLTYFVLLVSSIVMIVWLIMTINNFFNGELTTKSILKTLTVLAIAASIFSFYLYDIKREKMDYKKDKIIMSFLGISLLAIIGVFVWSLFVVDSPSATRNKRLDNTILDNFTNIDNALNEYYSKYGKQPTDLNTLRTNVAYLSSISMEDPTTKTPIVYRAKSDKEYELCATFRLSNRDDKELMTQYNNERWSHDAGYQCLSQKINTIKMAPGSASQEMK
jgi:hypothetical protein